jgi:hypothetical protein
MYRHMRGVNDYDDLVSITRISSYLSWPHLRKQKDVEVAALSVFIHWAWTLLVFIVSKGIPILTPPPYITVITLVAIIS